MTKPAQARNQALPTRPIGMGTIAQLREYMKKHPEIEYDEARKLFGINANEFKSGVSKLKSLGEVEVVRVIRVWNPK